MKERMLDLVVRSDKGTARYRTKLVENDDGTISTDNLISIDAPSLLEGMTPLSAFLAARQEMLDLAVAQVKDDPHAKVIRVRDDGQDSPRDPPEEAPPSKDAEGGDVGGLLDDLFDLAKKVEEKTDPTAATKRKVKEAEKKEARIEIDVTPPSAKPKARTKARAAKQKAPLAKRSRSSRR